MHTPKCVHRRQFNIYILKKERHLDKVNFWFLSHSSCGTLCKAESDIQFTKWCCIFAQCHLLVASSCYWLSRKRYSTFALHFFLNLNVHFVLPYIQFPIKKAKQCLKILMLSSFGRFSLWREIQLMV